ncbi:PREDICTED: uncharacterized protein LOC106816902 [Priapulus caudatus]|uniref:chitin synthase n=1 Tax=Priapulus caudatus TaxID=37621 RepID=A0ABM1EXV9_PRICU|nr:PREDICTED: uncharacterized protein LOC106816902 [Priapulus caudatus]
MKEIMPGYLDWNWAEVRFDGLAPVDKLTVGIELLVCIALIASHIRITSHIWFPACERLAKTIKLFQKPSHCSVLADVDLALNRRRDDGILVKAVKIPNDGNSDDLENAIPNENQASDEHLYYVRPEDGDAPGQANVQEDGVPVNNSYYSSGIDSDKSTIPKVYFCATMWHESTNEIKQILKSILRSDQDQNARRCAIKYLDVVDKDYYEFEVIPVAQDGSTVLPSAIKHPQDDESDEENISLDDLQNPDWITDDCMKYGVYTNLDEDEVIFWNGLIDLYLYPLTQRGRGRAPTQRSVKVNAMVRSRQRFAERTYHILLSLLQCMYMYYLLGYKLYDLMDVDTYTKQRLADNTYILALDGDVDFKPSAIITLVDLMKRNYSLGAACGRIHPIGSGPMVWYQKFEYAIGHWLQKSTEHMLGCVLCSPGCFSLFRASALLAPNVMKRYTTRSSEARHYVQYDQAQVLTLLLGLCILKGDETCLPHFLLYFISIPSMYMLLIIYSLCNLNDVSWGTREVAATKSKAEIKEDLAKGIIPVAQDGSTVLRSAIKQPQDNGKSLNPTILCEFTNTIIIHNLESRLSVNTTDKEQATVKVDLRNLRNKAVFFFSITNGLLIILLLLLQINQLYIPWPFGTNSSGEQIFLEPIGFFFLVFYVLILLVQLSAMFLHRWTTMSHIVALTDLCWESRTKQLFDADSEMDTYGVGLAMELQNLQGADEDDANAGSRPDDEIPVDENGRRLNIFNMANRSKKRRQTIVNYEEALVKRLQMIGTGDLDLTGPKENKIFRRLTMRRETLVALNRRVSTWQIPSDKTPKEIIRQFSDEKTNPNTNYAEMRRKSSVAFAFKLRKKTDDDDNDDDDDDDDNDDDDDDYNGDDGTSVFANDTRRRSDVARKRSTAYRNPAFAAVDETDESAILTKHAGEEGLGFETVQQNQPLHLVADVHHDVSSPSMAANRAGRRKKSVRFEKRFSDVRRRSSFT